jgi:glycosyltransferase involved in cell wall biosynthesis
MNILNAIVAEPDAQHGGAERAGLEFGDALSKYVDVDTVMMGGLDEHEQREIGISAKVHPIPAHTLLRDAANRIFPSSNNIWNAGITTRLKPPRRLQEYDLVHIHNAVPLAGMVCIASQCRLYSIPYCVTTHGVSKIPEIPVELGLTRPQRIVFEQVFLRAYQSVLRNAKHLFTLSEGDRDRIRTWFPEQSTSVIRNGVSVEQPDLESRDIEVIRDDIPTLLFVGRLMQSKGVDDLLEAYERLELDCQLLVAGPVRNEAYTDEIGSIDGATYLGYVDKSVLDQLYVESDLFVFPTRSDVFPLVTLEAMASETPVVTTKVGGLPEQIPDGAGYLVPPNDPSAVAEAIEYVLAEKSRVDKMGRRGRKAVSELYSWDAVAEEAVEVYSKLLSQT